MRTLKAISTSILLMSVLISANAQEYARPLHIPEGQKMVQHEGKKYLLIDGAWMQTEAPNKANVRYDNIWLPTDKLQISNSAEKELLENHKALKGSLTYKRNIVKVKSDKEALKDSVLRTLDTLQIKIESIDDNSVKFCLIINDTTLITNDSFKTGDDITINPEIIGLTSEKICENLRDNQSSELTIGKIMILPEGHVPSFVNKISRTSSITREDIKGALSIPLWVMITGGVLILVIIGIVVWFFVFRGKKNEEEDLRVKAATKMAEEGKDSELETESSHKSDFVGKQESASSNEEKTLEKKVSNSGIKVDPKDNQIAELKKQKEELSKKISDLKSEQSKKIAEAVEEEKQKSLKKIETLEEEKKNLKKDLNDEKNATAKKVSEAREEEKQKGQKKIDALEEEKKILKKKVEEVKEEEQKKAKEATEKLQSNLDETKKKFDDTSKELDLTKDTLKKTEDDLAFANDTIDNLKESQKKFTERISFVPFAKSYATKIQELLAIADNINASAATLLEEDIEDPYYIYKALGRYHIAMNDIDYGKFMTDVKMAASNDISFSNSGISNLLSLDDKSRETSLKSYFLSAYLEKYINALVVYNESLAGVHGLIEDVSKEKTRKFVEYRKELDDCFAKLGIKVLYVKLFDQLGDNIDLKAKMVDFDDRIPADAIIEIQNCIVYLEGTPRPSDKIYVTAQK